MPTLLRLKPNLDEFAGAEKSGRRHRGNSDPIARLPARQLLLADDQAAAALAGARSGRQAAREGGRRFFFCEQQVRGERERAWRDIHTGRMALSRGIEDIHVHI